MNEENGYKKWEDMNNDERKESINRYIKAKIVETINTNSAFWKKDREMEKIQKTRPYNAQTGKYYSGINSIILEGSQNQHDYKENSWISMKQANFLGVKIPNGTKGVKISYLKTHEAILKLDKNGNPKKEYLKDKDGNPKIVQSGKNQGKKAYKYTYDIKELEKPQIETTTLFNTEQIPELSKEKIKSPILESRDGDVSLSQLNIIEKTRMELEQYIKAQNEITAYKVPTIEKQQEQSQSIKR